MGGLSSGPAAGRATTLWPGLSVSAAHTSCRPWLGWSSSPCLCWALSRSHSSQVITWMWMHTSACSSVQSSWLRTWLSCCTTWRTEARSRAGWPQESYSSLSCRNGSSRPLLNSLAGEVGVRWSLKSLSSSRHSIILWFYEDSYASGIAQFSQYLRVVMMQQ